MIAVKKYISPSAISSYLSCPRKFYYYYNEYPSIEIETEPLIVGKLTHEIIARYYQIVPNYATPREVRMYVTKAFKEKMRPEYEPFRDRIESLLLNFIKFEEKRLTMNMPAKPIAVEKEFVKEPVHGIVDALFRKLDGKLVVVDWKTGKKGRLTEDIIIQMNVYLYLTGAEEALVVFLHTGGYSRVSRDPKINIKAIVEEILSDNRYPPMPAKPYYCDTCPFQIICKFHREGINPLEYSMWEGLR